MWGADGGIASGQVRDTGGVDSAHCVDVCCRRFDGLFQSRGYGLHRPATPGQLRLGLGRARPRAGRDASAPGVKEATRTVTPFELEYRIRRSDGEYRWHAFRALPIRGRDDEVEGWLGTAFDIGDVL